MIRRHAGITRDLVMFILGVGLVINEAVRGSDRANLLYVGFACIAGGAFGRAYAHLNGNQK